MTGSEGSKTSSAKKATPRQWRLSAPTWFYVFIPQKLGSGLTATLLPLFVVFVPFPIFLTDTLGATNAQVFLISLIKFTIDALLYVPMGRVVQRRRGIGLLAQATAVRVGIFGLFALIALVRPGPIGLLVVAFVHIFSGVTWAAIAVSGTTAVAMLAPKGVEGRALGLYNAIIGAGGIAGSLAGGYLAQVFGYAVSFGTAALLMGLTAVWLWRLRAAVLSETSHPGSVQQADRRG